MDKVASLTAKDRRDLFRESAARRGMSPAVVFATISKTLVERDSRKPQVPHQLDRSIYTAGRQCFGVSSISNFSFAIASLCKDGHGEAFHQQT